MQCRSRHALLPPSTGMHRLLATLLMLAASLCAIAPAAGRAPAEGRTWGGIDPLVDGPDFDSSAALTGGTRFIPAEPQAAAGWDHVVTTTNGLLVIYDKNGAERRRESLKRFFSPPGFANPPRTHLFSPRVLYDTHHNRFVVMALELRSIAAGDTEDRSDLFLAVSDTTSALGDWTVDRLNVSEGVGGNDCWLGLPGLGVDEEAVYLTGLLFRFSNNAPCNAGRLFVISKEPGGVYFGGPIVSTRLNPFAVPGAVLAAAQPARILGDPPLGGVGTWLVSAGLSSGINEQVQIIRIDRPLDTPTFTAFVRSLGDVGDSTGNLPAAPQSGSTTSIDTGSRRALDAVWRDGALWLSSTLEGNGGPDLGQATAAWVRIDTASMQVLDQGRIGGETLAFGAHTFYPALSINAWGQAAIGFSASAATIFPGAYVVTRRDADTPGVTSAPIPLRQGTDFYVRTGGGANSLWGTLSALATDPIDECFWVFNQASASRGSASGGEDGRWATSLGRVCVCDGDESTPDTDLDGICADRDNCPVVANHEQFDSDADGVGNGCDNCILVANPDQIDSDGDGAGDVCDAGIASATALSMAPTPSVFGQWVTLTATVAGSGAATAGGNVRFMDGATVLGTRVLSAGTASLQVAVLSPGTHTLAAEYLGDTVHAGSRAEAIHRVDPAAAQISVTTAPSPSVFGQVVALSATVSTASPGGGTPAGSVTFFDGNTLLGSATLNPAGVTSIAATALTGGIHALSARFDGSTQHGGVTSAPREHTVNRANVSLTLDGSASSTVFGQSLSLTASARALLPGGGVPGGLMRFRTNTQTLGEVALDAAGVATFSVGNLSVGAHTISAEYLGTGDHAPATSPIRTHTVTPAATSIALAPLPATALYSAPLALVAQVSTLAPGSGTAQGSVVFLAGTTELGSATLDALGSARLQVTTLALGMQSISARYQGGGNHLASTSAAIGVLVERARASLVFSVTPSPSVYGEVVALFAAADSVAPASVTPTGSVRFYDGTVLLAERSLDAEGRALFTVSTLGGGLRGLRIEYDGDAFVAPADPQLRPHEVQRATPSMVLASTPNPSSPGATVRLQVDLAGPAGAAAPGGLVEFFDDQIALGSTTVDVQGRAVLDTAALPAGVRNLQAAYGGDANYTTRSAAAAHTVAGADALFGDGFE